METEFISIENSRDMRFGEILVFKKAHIDVYNTTGLNDCPAELWDALDLDELKEQHHAHKVIKNGPHYWVMDTNGFEVGETVLFGGLETRWAAKLGLKIAIKAARGAVPYEIFQPKKKQKQVYSAGKPVYELVDAEGHAYVLQAHEERFPIDSLGSLGDQMEKLPAGWQYRTRTPTEDLVLDLGPEDTIYAVGDEWLQYYTRIPDGA